MNYPKIVFQEMTLSDNIDLIQWSYFEKDETLNLHYYTIQCFPELANINSKLSHEEINKVIEEVVTKDYYKNQEIIKKEARRYQMLWNQYNDIYFEALENYLQIKWPSSIHEIIATVGMIPVFPRYLDDFSFSIGTGVDESKLIEVCAHETLHFLWFEKWKKMHPEISREEYDSPYLSWKYSEMVTDPILNSKPFSKILPIIERGYDSFYELDEGRVMKQLKSIYQKEIPIEEKIEEGYQYLFIFFKEKEKESRKK